jgi:hypothetical protein
LSRFSRSQSLRGTQELRQPVVEEEHESRGEDRESRPLDGGEPLVENDHASHEQQERRELYHDLRHRRRRVVERNEVEHEVPDQRQRRRADQRNRRAAGAANARQCSSPGEECAKAGHRDGEAPPHDGERVHGLEHDLERDRQQSPQRGGRERERDAEPPVRRAACHARS